MVDKDTQEKIDVVKSRLIKNRGYCEICATDALNFVGFIFAKGDSAKAVSDRSFMNHPVRMDHSRFRKIVRIRDNLRKFVSKGEMPTPKGDGTFKIPMPSIETPHFRFGDKNQRGTGQGKGQPGDPVDGQQGEEPGQGEAEGREARNLK